jgi:hypothetical protein
MLFNIVFWMGIAALLAIGVYTAIDLWRERE